MARADGELVTSRAPSNTIPRLAILTDKDPDSLKVFRHSAAHLLAAAVLELFPDVKLGIGPPIDYGFFYEFLREEPFTPEDLDASKKACTSSPRATSPTNARCFPRRKPSSFTATGIKSFNCELVEEKATEPMVSFYTTGKFIDFCRGPHIPSTGRIGFQIDERFRRLLEGSGR